MAAYAAATGSTTSYEKIARAASPGEGDLPSRGTVVAYRTILEQLWVLDPVPAWVPTKNLFTRLGAAPKHFLADPALAARLLRIDGQQLLGGRGSSLVGSSRDTTLGRLFEHLVALSLHSYTQVADAYLSHFRSSRGDREIDFIIHRDGGATIACEVKLSRVVNDEDVRHLLWLRERLGEELCDCVVITAGSEAYRRPDGIAVIPLALLGP